MKIEAVGAATGAAVMIAVTWAMWVCYQRELDRALSSLNRLS